MSGAFIPHCPTVSPSRPVEQLSSFSCSISGAATVYADVNTDSPTTTMGQNHLSHPSSCYKIFGNFGEMEPSLFIVNRVYHNQ